MKKTNQFRILLFTFIVSGILLTLSSCNKDDFFSSNDGKITGIVTDKDGNPISDVTVTVSGIDEESSTTVTGNDGSYTIEDISLKTHSVKFTKTGWLTVAVTVTAGGFDDNNTAKANISMIKASYKITGKVTDGKNGGAPLSGVVVSIGVAGSATTNNVGVYEINNLVAENYTVTFIKDGYSTIEKTISIEDFNNNNGIVIIDIQMGNLELLRGLTIDNLINAEKWYYNEYRGGRNADAYPHWDWACNYMSTLNFVGTWEEQNEGTTLQIRNNNEERNNPANLDVFDSFVYGSKKITADNKILSLRLRTHSADATNPAYYGVQVVDLSATNPVAVKIGGVKTYGSGDYSDVEFNLSDYVGKEVIIAIGIYRQTTGDYWKQLVLRAIRFSDRKVENWDWLPGTEVIPGWKLSVETARSTMVNTKKSFTGISTISGNRDNYVGAYRAWRDINHIAANWIFMPIKKDPEVFASEGYVLKTRNTSDVDTKVPESYFYSKFAVSSGANMLTLKIRNFGANFTYFKITAIEDNGTITHVSPTSNTATQASAASDGCWKFKNDKGSPDSPADYAQFVYDLSQFNGKDVCIVLGVYNGEANTGENKISIYKVELN